MRSHRKGTKSEGKNPPHINPIIDSNWRRNGEYMSVTSNRNKSNRIFDRKCNDRSNRWQDSDSGTDSRSGFREFIKACMQSTRHQKNSVNIRSAIGNTGRLRASGINVSWPSVSGSMETKKRARLAEEMEATRTRELDRKGKGVMKEEDPEEVFEIPDTSDEDVSHVQSMNAEEWEQYAMGVSQRSLRGRRVPQRGRRRKIRHGVCEAAPIRGQNREANKARDGKGEEPDQSRRPGRRARQTFEHKIQHAERAYVQNTNPKIRRIIQNMEEEAIQAQSDSEMEDWELLVHDPGNTRGRMSLFKESLHIYWVMKQFLAKALEHVAIEVAELAQGVPNLRRELHILQISMEMQGKQLGEIQQLLKDSEQKRNKEDSPILANAVE